MIDRQGRAKLLDFGLAHLTELSTESRDTSLGRLLGTLDYMAPEQADCERGLDPRVDLFGLGATLFYLLTGQPPHGDHSKGSLLAQLRALVAEERPPSTRCAPMCRPNSTSSSSHCSTAIRHSGPNRRRAWLGPCRLGPAETWLRTSKSCAEFVTRKSHGRQMRRKTGRRRRQAARIAKRSLSELLRTGLVAIPEERSLPVAPQPEPEPPRRGSGRKIAAWVAAAALVGAVLFGVTILLKTPEGTLRSIPTSTM